ncbi:hypothetical protein ACLOJK_005224 [Asimina triloba]
MSPVVSIDKLVLFTDAGSQNNPASATSPEVDKKALTDVDTHSLVLSTAVRFQRHPVSGTPLSRIFSSSPFLFRCCMPALAMLLDKKLDVDVVGVLDVFDEMPNRNLASINV